MEGDGSLRAAIDAVAAIASRTGIALDERQRELLARHAALLREWNERVNLTAILDPLEIATKHVLDSLVGLLVRRWRGTERVVDVGSGGGFPGVPLAVALPAAHVTLVESVGKKARFLETVSAELGLSRLTVVRARAEDLARDGAHRDRYDVATARALPGVGANLELLLPLVRVGGDALLYKGRVETELPAGRRAAAALGAEIVSVTTTDRLGLAAELPGRCVLLARKRAATPRRYPRPAAEMKRRPWR